MTHASRTSTIRAGVAAIATLVLVAAGLTVTASPASAVANTVLCRTYEGCAALGMTDHGYSKKSSKSYWRMTEGHNCTNYVAYLMVKRGMANSRPWNGNGNSNGWGHYGNPRDKVPAVGAVAWWDANKNGAGALGHVAHVEAVLSPDLIVISEDNWGGEFFWRVIRKGDAGWPTGFLHFDDTNGPNNVPELSVLPVSQTVYTDSRKRTTLDPQYLKPGSAAWVSVTYQNLGSQDWSGLQLATAGPFDRISAVASGWTTRAATQRQALVGIGQTATFDFPVRIPADAVTGTVFSEQFVPAFAGGGALPSGTITVDLRADTRDLFTSTAAPLLIGTPREGFTLSVEPGLWTPAVDSYAYQWYRAGTPIAGATSSSYTLTGADVGTAVSVDVMGDKANHVPVTQTVETALVRSASSNTLRLSKGLKAGDQIVSSNGQFQATQTSTGKFVVKNRFTKKVVFSTGTTKSVRTKLRRDGVLVSYGKSGRAVWNSGTKGKKVTRAVVTNSGKLVLYTSKGKIAWNSAKQAKKR